MIITYKYKLYRTKRLRKIDEITIFETIKELRKMEEEAAEKTKLHRRRKENKKVSKPLSQTENKKERTIKPFKPKIEKFEIDFDDDE